MKYLIAIYKWWSQYTTNLKDDLAGVNAKPGEIRICRYYPNDRSW